MTDMTDMTDMDGARPSHRRRAAWHRRVATLVLVAMLFAGCTGRGATNVTATVTSTPSPTVTAPPPSPVPTPGLPLAIGAVPAIVGEVIVATSAHDLDRLVGLVRYQPVACTKALGVGGPPKCKPGDPEGSVYAVFQTGRCEPEWTEDARPVLAQMVASASQLYAAAAIVPPDSALNLLKGQYAVMFTTGNVNPPGVYFILVDGGIVSAHFECGAGVGAQGQTIRLVGGVAYIVPPRVP